MKTHDLFLKYSCDYLLAVLLCPNMVYSIFVYDIFHRNESVSIMDFKDDFTQN